MHRFRSDSGAAAVEFALVVPLLILLAFGIIEFGRMYNLQNSLTSAAREGVRSMAINNNPANARVVAWNSAPSLSSATAGAVATVQVCADPSNASTCNSTTPCVAGSTALLTLSYPPAFITGAFGSGPTLQGIGVMRCGG